MNDFAELNLQKKKIQTQCRYAEMWLGWITKQNKFIFSFRIQQIISQIENLIK